MKVYAVVEFEELQDNESFEKVSDLMMNSVAHIVFSNVNGETLAELDAEVHQVSKDKYPS